MIHRLGARRLKGTTVEHEEVAVITKTVNSKTAAVLETTVLLAADELPGHPEDVLESGVAKLMPNRRKLAVVTGARTTSSIESYGHGGLDLRHGNSVIPIRRRDILLIDLRVVIAIGETFFHWRNDPTTHGEDGALTIFDRGTGDVVDRVAAGRDGNNTDGVHERLVQA